MNKNQPTHKKRRPAYIPARIEQCLGAMSGLPVPAGVSAHRGVTCPANLIGIILDIVLRQDAPLEVTPEERSILAVGRAAYDAPQEKDPQAAEYPDNLSEPAGFDGFVWVRERRGVKRASSVFPSARRAKNAARVLARPGDRFYILQVSAGVPIDQSPERPLWTSLPCKEQQRVEWLSSRGGSDHV